MRLTISKSLFLVAITMGLFTGANSAAEASPQMSTLSQDALVSDGGLQYLAQFPGSRNRPDFDDDDFEDRFEDLEDRRDDIEDRFDDIDRDDIEDFRDDMEDRFDDRDNSRRGPRW